MTLDTYRSMLVDGVFVTLPSVSGEATIELVDELSSLDLAPVRRNYELPGDEGAAPFARFVLTEIVLKGYATHGPAGSFDGIKCRDGSLSARPSQGR